MNYAIPYIAECISQKNIGEYTTLVKYRRDMLR
jgi:hypothetical protein